ncbi:PUA domain-containing protein, partial [Lysobacter sp. 1R34A]|uniref:PUA domain-containing protein n=1 Tax=Lysobacter sp. 1R34A TaxID=3445786 RepID=UPI003EEB9E44
GASLLPGGVVAAEGEFRRGDVVELRGVGDAAGVLGRGLIQYNAGEVRRIAGRHSRDIEALIGFRYGESVVHRDDLVLLERAGESPRDTEAGQGPAAELPKEVLP